MRRETRREPAMNALHFASFLLLAVAVLFNVLSLRSLGKITKIHTEWLRMHSETLYGRPHANDDLARHHGERN